MCIGFVADSDINWLLRVQIAYAVAKALRAVHAEGVTLHDFKTSNVLIDEVKNFLSLKFITFKIISENFISQ